MKCFIKNSLIIFHIILNFKISKCENGFPVVYADVDKIEERELYNFFLRLSTNKGVISRMVFIDGKKTSLENLFQLSNPRKSNESIPEIKMHIYEILYIINIVVSCGYSDFVFSTIKTLDIVNKIMFESKNVKIQIHSKDYQEIVLKPIINVISSMILTLISLQKNTKNFVSKSYNILKILLSWYAY